MSGTGFVGVRDHPPADAHRSFVLLCPAFKAEGDRGSILPTGLRKPPPLLPTPPQPKTDVDAGAADTPSGSRAPLLPSPGQPGRLWAPVSVLCLRLRPAPVFRFAPQVQTSSFTVLTWAVLARTPVLRRPPGVATSLVAILPRGSPGSSWGQRSPALPEEFPPPPAARPSR